MGIHMGAFGLKACINLSCKGYHSVRIVAGSHGKVIGIVEVWQGTLWSATQGRSKGEVALRQLLKVSCRINVIPMTSPSTRTLDHSLAEHLRPGIPACGIRRKRRNRPITQSFWNSRPEAPQGTRAQFNTLLETYLDAILDRNLHAAWRAMVKAERLMPNSREVQTNLQRLRLMGFSGDVDPRIN